MKITSAQFVRGVIGSDPFLEDERPVYAFVGRSNVGKSSVINMLLGRKDLVRSSGVPGKTQQINYFLINDLFYFVDLPGYGFAKTGQKQREKIRRMILWYLSSGEVTPKKVVLIIDAKVGLAEFDREMIDLLRSQQYSFLVVLNKADKLNNSDRSRVLRDVSAEVGGEDVFLFSARTGMGKDKLLSSLFS